MNLPPPPEDPELKSEPKALSPVSPKPLYIPVPSNIPLLQLQGQMEAPIEDGGAGAEVVHEAHEEAEILPPAPATDEPLNTSDAKPTDEPPVVAEHVAAPPKSPEMPSQAAVAVESSASAEPSLHDTVQPHAIEAQNQSAEAPPPPATQASSLPIGTDYQALLNSLTKVPAPASPGAAPSYIPLEESLKLPNQPAAPGGSLTLPPRPPPQASSGLPLSIPTDIRQFHPAGANAISSASPSNFSAGANSLPAPPGASFQGLNGGGSPSSARPRPEEDDESRWGPEIQKEFDMFLEQERHFVTEGNWEQFPHGSRLFVGNLSSERVTKRDVFHVFHKYGSLAQISIKQAYGFVQFLKSADCGRAMAAEQGRVIRGKRINLEVSKPQKNSRNSGAGAGRKRSRSPERGGGADRYNGGGGRRGRDDYRPGRSPSPKRRDRSRDRHARYRSRSRSPRRDRYRSPSPRRGDKDDDLPLPRRAPHEVPDVQIIAADNLDRGFIQWVEKAFAGSAVKVDVLILSPRLSETAVIRRQIIEGVTAVCKLSMANQQKGKIGLQVFDRRGGAEVRFEEYADLDPQIAAQVVLRAKANNQPSYGYGYGGGAANAASPTFPPPGGLPANISNAIGSMDANSLQKLLGAIQQPGQPGMADISKLLGNVQSGAQPAGYGQSPTTPQDPLAALRNNPALAGLLAGQALPAPPSQPLGQQQQRPSTGGGQPDMADILAKLGSYRR